MRKHNCILQKFDENLQQRALKTELHEQTITLKSYLKIKTFERTLNAIQSNFDQATKNVQTVEQIIHDQILATNELIKTRC